MLIAISASASVIVVAGDVFTLLAGSDEDSTWGKLAKYFWADGEANLWSWYSSAILLTAAWGFAFLGLMQQPGRMRRAYWILAGVMTYMSADEVASLHELLRHGGLNTHFTRQWLLLGIPIAVVVGVGVLRTARFIDTQLRRRLIFAGVIYLAGSVLIEAFGGFMAYQWGVKTWQPAYVLEVTVEKGLEFIGSLLALDAVARTVAAHLITRGDETVTSGSQGRGSTWPAGMPARLCNPTLVSGEF